MGNVPLATNSIVTRKIWKINLNVKGKGKGLKELY